MDGLRDRLLITLRFIYDFNFIYLLFLLVTTIIYLVLSLGHDGKYELLQIWFQIIGLYRENETSYFIQVIIIPIYNFLDWLLSGKYQVLPKLITKLIKGRISLMLKTSISFLVLLYLTSLFVGIYVTNQQEKAAEEARIAKEIQEKKNAEIYIQRTKERRLREEQAEKEKEQAEKEKRLSKITFPYQGLSCKHDNEKYEDIVLVLKKNNDGTKFEIDLRTRDITLDGVIYNFETIKNTIKVTEAEFKIDLNNPYNSYNLGEDFDYWNKIVLSRSSLDLLFIDGRGTYGSKYKCKQTSHIEVYNFVEKHNAKITDKNKI